MKVLLRLFIFLISVMSILSFTAFAEDENSITDEEVAIDSDAKSATNNVTDGSASNVSKATAIEISDVELKNLVEAKNTKSEIQVIRAVSDILSHDPDNLKALNTLGIFYFENKKFGLAKIILKRALQKHPNVAALHNNIGIIYLAENDLPLALDSFKKSIELKAENNVGAINLSSIYLQYQDYARSLSVLEESFKATRSDLRRGKNEAVELANNYAIACMGVGENDRASEAFEGIYKSNSKNPLPYLNYLIFKVEVQKNKKDANRIISKLKSITEDREILRRAQELLSKLE